METISTFMTLWVIASCWRKIFQSKTTLGYRPPRSDFLGIYQLLFHPITDPISLKRLARCFVWSKRVLSVFFDPVDLPSLRGFLRIPKAKVSQIDAAAAAKQRETFVSSAGRELSASSCLPSTLLALC